MVCFVETSLNALQEIVETVVPGWINPWVGLFCEAGNPLLVGHFGDVAEVRLRGLCQSRDDFITTGVVFLDWDRGDQARCLRERVINLVQVSQQVRLGGGNAAVSLQTANPAAVGIWGDTWGVNEQLLNVIVCGCFLGCHGYGAQEDTINRHDWKAVLGGPGTGQVLGCAVRGVDAATDGDGKVVMLACCCIGSKQHLIQVNPGVVATSVAVFDLDDDAVRRVIRSNCDAVLNLLGGTWLERDIREAISGELIE